MNETVEKLTKENETLKQMLEQKIKYIEKIEDMLVNQNRKSDDTELEMNELRVKSHIYKKNFETLKGKYNKLYEFAKELCNVIEKQQKKMDELVEVNNQMSSVNKQCFDKLNIFISLI
jgi:hypothetical protein